VLASMGREGGLWSPSKPSLGREDAIQYSLAYPATYDPARSGRINARTGLSNTSKTASSLVDPISFGPV
jgi:hypothetical protein